MAAPLADTACIVTRDPRTFPSAVIHNSKLNTKHSELKVYAFPRADLPILTPQEWFTAYHFEMP